MVVVAACSSNKGGGKSGATPGSAAECKADADCVIVETACCDHCNGVNLGLNLLLVPGPQTRSSFYLQNLQRPVEVFTQAGLNVRRGSLDPAVEAPVPLALPDGSELMLEPLQRKRGRLGLKDFDP